MWCSHYEIYHVQNICYCCAWIHCKSCFPGGLSKQCVCCSAIICLDYTPSPDERVFGDKNTHLGFVWFILLGYLNIYILIFLAAYGFNTLSLVQKQKENILTFFMQFIFIVSFLKKVVCLLTVCPFLTFLGELKPSEKLFYISVKLVIKQLFIECPFYVL